jgi:hypothetical protein
MIAFCTIGFLIGCSFFAAGIAIKLLRRNKTLVDPEVEAWRLAHARARCKLL